MRRRLTLAIASLATVALAGCGGGGGDGYAVSSNPSTPVVSTATFQVRQAWVNTLTVPASRTFSVQGTGQLLAGATINDGSGTATFGTLQPATFLGNATLASTMVVNGTLIQPNQHTTPYSRTSTIHVDSGYLPVGMVDESGWAPLGAGSIPPPTAKVGDSGLLTRLVTYSNDTDPKPVATRTLSWTLAADTASTAIFAIVINDYQLDGSVSRTITDSARVNPDGTLVRISEQVSSTNQTSLTLAYR